MFPSTPVCESIMPARGRKPLLGTKKFKPITMGPSFAIGGGLLKEQSCVTLEGPGNKYLLVKKKSPWLCMATSGVTYSKAPLHRTKLLDIFDDVLNAGPDELSIGVPDKMKSLMTSKSGANTSALAASSSSALAAHWPCQQGLDQDGCSNSLLLRWRATSMCYISVTLPQPPGCITESES